VKRATGCFFIFVALLILVAFALYAGAVRVMKTRGVRARLAGELANFFECNAAVAPLRWNGLTISAPGVLARDAPLPAEIRLSQVSAPLTIVDLWRNDWKIDKVTVADVQAAFGDFAMQQLNRTSFATSDLSPPTSGTAELDQVNIRHATILYGSGSANAGEFRDVHVRTSRHDSELIIKGDGGTFRLAGFPEAFLLDATITYAKPNLRIARASLSFGDVNSIEVTGSINFEQPQNVHAAGAVVMANAILKNVPTFQRVAQLTGRSELAQAKIDNVKADFDWNANTLTAKNFSGEAKQLFAVRGEFVLQDGKLNGEFELGLVPELVEKFPGAREDVFKSSRDGYLWTPVSVSGRVDDVRDNLRPRLLRAAQDHHADAKIIDAIEDL